VNHIDRIEGVDNGGVPFLVDPRFQGRGLARNELATTRGTCVAFRSCRLGSILRSLEPTPGDTFGCSRLVKVRKPLVRSCLSRGPETGSRNKNGVSPREEQKHEDTVSMLTPTCETRSVKDTSAPAYASMNASSHTAASSSRAWKTNIVTSITWHRSSAL
jgi:hypothetical protein